MSDFTAERWLPVPGYEGYYEVSDHGRVWSWITRRYLKPVLRGHAVLYPSVALRGRIHKIHRLVLLAFVGPPPEGANDGCHNDGCPLNNRLPNLRWDSRAGNVADTVRMGHTSASWTHCRRGHEFTPENTGANSNGGRRCRACDRLRANPEGRVARKDLTECPAGHFYDEANTGHSRRGGRYCRRCARERMQAKRDAARRTDAA